MHQIKKKLNDKSGRYIFISFALSSKGSKLYNPNNGNIIVSKDVKFNEEEAWDWDAQEYTMILFPSMKKKNKQLEAYK